MLDFMDSRYYLYTVVFIVMPLNGLIMTSNLILGIILILGQIPFLIGRLHDA